MNALINENELKVVKEYKIVNPPIQNINSIISECYRDCHNKYFHIFDFICEYNLNFTKTNNNDLVNFTISDKNMGMYELNQKLTLAKQRGFKFNHIIKLTIKIYSNLKYINIHYHLTLGASPLHRRFFMNLLKNPDYIQTHCNDINNPFHFSCRQWYSYKNPDILT